jgi:hypothetical protein
VVSTWIPLDLNRLARCSGLLSLVLARAASATVVLLFHLIRGLRTSVFAAVLGTSMAVTARTALVAALVAALAARLAAAGAIVAVTGVTAASALRSEVGLDASVTAEVRAMVRAVVLGAALERNRRGVRHVVDEEAFSEVGGHAPGRGGAARQEDQRLRAWDDVRDLLGVS